MRYDEAVTYLYFARLPWIQVIATYTYPNNHILHTVLVKASTTLFGTAPAAIRVPALLAGIALIPATYAAARALYGGRAALVATAVVATSGALILYSTNARGYTLVVLAFLLLVLVGVRVLHDAAASDWLAFAAIAAFGLWTIPTMLYPLGAVALWIALSLALDDEPRSRDLRRLVSALAIAAVYTLILYTPVLTHEGLSAITRNKFVASSDWFTFLGELPTTLRQAIASWTLGIPLVAAVLSGLLVIVALRHHASLTRSRVSLPLAAFVWSAWLLAVNHRAPYARVWLWLLPLVAALAGAGLLRVAQLRGRAGRFLDRRFAALVAGLALLSAASVVWTRAVPLSLDTGTYRDAPQAAVILARIIGPSDRVLAAIPTNAPLAYYLARRGVPAAALTRDERAAAHVIAVVNEAEHQTLDDVAGRSLVHDSTIFSDPRLLARLPSSALVIFDRRDVARQ